MQSAFALLRYLFVLIILFVSAAGAQEKSAAPGVNQQFSGKPECAAWVESFEREGRVASPVGVER
jgi:hypothetical protein